MAIHKSLNRVFVVMVLASMILSGGGPVIAKSAPPPMNASQPVQPSPASVLYDDIGQSNGSSGGRMRTTTQAMRMAAAANQAQRQKGVTQKFAGLDPATEALSPLAGESQTLATMAPALSAPDYFGVANWANSPLPQLDATGAVVPGTGIRKFVDTLPGLCGVSAPNGLGQCIPVAAPITSTFPGSDYYEIGLVEYREQMHPDLPITGTEIRGYVQIVPSAYPGAVALTTANGLTMDIKDSQGNQVYGATKPHYLGPLILAQGCEVNSPGCNPRAVRVKFTNYLPTGPAGDLFIPTDTTYMGAGMGPGGSIKSVTLTSKGAGYASAPTVVFNNTGTGGTGAAATAKVSNGVVLEVVVTNGGSGYTTPPAVSFIGGGGAGAAATSVLAGKPGEMYTQNRATLHLHGGNTPWISDGTPHQWTTPQGELTSYSKGDSVSYVPDMWFDANGNLIASCAGQLTCAVPGASNDPGLGSLTFYWTNQESGRLLFYHDHAYGITRLNVYAGEAAGYLITDPAEENALAAAGFPGTIPNIYNLATADLAHLIPLVIQDKTFVPDDGVPGGQLAATDPTWDTVKYGGKGNMWLPHVWMPNQNPADVTGANAYGRWDYGPWFWPPQDPSTFVPGGLPYPCTSAFYDPPNPPPAFPPLMCPGIPNPSGAMEGMMDTPVINGAAYPSLTVDPTAYRFQVLSVGNDRAWNLGLYVADPLNVAVTKGGSGYTLPPFVSFTGGGGTGAAATAQMSNGSVTSILITGVGHGYTVAPNVAISGNGAGATAKAVVDPVTGTILAINVTNMGSGYTYANVTIDPPLGCTTGCVTATATATVTPPGVVLGIVVTNSGSGWTSAPTVSFTNAPGDTTGAGAAAIASINSEVKMVDAVPHTSSSALPLCSTATATSGAMLALADLDANGNPVNGTGLQAGCWPTTWPTDGRDGGVPDPLTAGPPIIQIGTESGLLPAPVIIPSTPVGYEYNRKSITVLNVFNHGLLLGPAERADLLVDFSQFAGKTLILYNDGPAPVPAFDPRNDYYTGDPDQTSSGGAPTTLPGYGPNTRTLMQIKVKAAAAGGAALSSITVTNGGSGYKAPSVAISGGGGTGAAATASGSVSGLVLTNAGTGYLTPTIAFSGGGGSGASAAFSSGAVSGLTLTSGGSSYASAPSVSFSGGGGSLAAAKATVSIAGLTLIGAGSGYGSAPVVAITDPTGAGTGATAKTTVSVTGLTLVSGGTNYTSPTVTISDTIPGPGTLILPGPGSGATATATVVGGVITGITLVTNGAGYTAPVVTITDATGTGASATTTGAVDSLTLLTPGAHYTAPVVTFTGGTPTTAATAATTGVVDSLTVTSPGSGYTSAPTVGFSGGGGAGAAATATIASTGIVLISGGSGYTSAPLVTITDTPPGTGSGATAYATLSINSVTLTSPGSGYTSVPVVTIVDTLGGTGTGAAATANMAGGAALNLGLLQTTVPSLFATVQNQMIVPEPDFPVGNGNAAQPTYVRIQDTSLASWIGGPVGSLTLTTGGSGYTSAPSVSITGGGGTGATAALTFIGANVNSLTLTAKGSGYTSAPTVVFSGGGGTGAAATALLTRIVNAVTVVNGGSGYTSAPAVSFSGGGGTGAAATASITGVVNSVTVVNRGSGYTSAPTVVFTGGGGTGAAATATIAGGRVNAVTITNRGSGYTSAPTVSFTGGGGTGATATATFTRIVNSVTVTNGGSGYTSAPTVSFSGGGGSGASATASITGIVNSLLLTNGGTGYTSNPAVSFTGGGGTGAAATATYLPGAVASLTLTNGGTGYTSAPTVNFTGGGNPTTPAAAVANTPVTPLQPKAIQELFTLDYGRMNATFGVEVPFTNFFVQTTIPYGYVDPPTEILKDGEIQLWKITHNGVDTHFIHFHLFDVQVVNRVGWDGMIKPPDANEVAWKDTVRMSPLEDVIIALRPMKQRLPFELPNSVRTMDVTLPIGANNPNNTFGFTNIDPTNQPAPVNNDLVNFGWEYVWHCHILSHEEIDMMRPMSFAVPPDAPINVTATRVGSGNNQSVVVTWVDRSINETGFTVQRATSLTGPWLSLTPSAPAAPGISTTLSYVDTTVARRTSYFYRVIANNLVGYTQTYAAPAVGYPTVSADSVPVNAAAPVTILSLAAPIFADSFETGLGPWSGVAGNVQVITRAVVGPYGGKLGMAAPVGSQPAYVYDTTPNGETMYDANFYFNPNRALSSSPLDIFIGLDQNGQPMFGVQYQSAVTTTFQLRAWLMQNGEQVFTPWATFVPQVEEGEEEDNIVNLTHKIDVAWVSSANGGFSLYLDDNLVAAQRADTSAYQLDEVLLGPTLGLTAGASGTMYFDEFTSSRLDGVQYFDLYLPVIYR